MEHQTLGFSPDTPTLILSLAYHGQPPMNVCKCQGISIARAPQSLLVLNVKLCIVLSWNSARSLVRSVGQLHCF